MLVVPRQSLLKSIVVWFAILLVAIGNGALRDLVLVNNLGPTLARLLSGVVLCTAIIVVATLSARWLGTASPAQRWRIGALWLVLTLGFELAIGYLRHQSWNALLDAYTFQGGNLWPLVLATTVIAPWAGARIRGVE